MADNRKIAFIICVNNEAYFEECRYFIERLHVPDGYETDVLAIRDADSMCAAYNLGMQSSDAKYKIYMHQDVFIRNEDFLVETISRFTEKPQTGMIGMMGGNKMPRTGVTYLAWDIGLVDCRDADMSYLLSGRPEITRDTVVEAVDGLLIATQYDLPWREDLFHDFDFYDVSQSFEMRRQGYDIVVPFQRRPWVIHDSSFAKLSNYDYNRKLCLEEYPEYLYADDGFVFEYHKEWEELGRALAEQLKQLITEGKWEAVCQVIAEYRRGKMKDSTLEMIGIISDIWQADGKAQNEKGLFEGITEYEQVYERYIEVRFLLRRMELGMPDTAYRKLSEMIEKGALSYDVLMIFLIHMVLDKRSVLLKVKDIYQRVGKYRQAEALDQLLQKLGTTELPVTYTKRVSTMLRSGENV